MVVLEGPWEQCVLGMEPYVYWEWDPMCFPVPSCASVLCVACLLCCETMTSGVVCAHVGDVHLPKPHPPLWSVEGTQPGDTDVVWDFLLAPSLHLH